MSRIYESVGYISEQATDPDRILTALRGNSVLIYRAEYAHWLIAVPKTEDHNSYPTRVFEPVGSIRQDEGDAGSIAMAIKNGHILVETEGAENVIAIPSSDGGGE